jgi:hypothetical protein
MKYKNLILGLFAIVAAVVTSIAIMKHKLEIHHADDPLANSIIDSYNPISIKTIDVIGGDEFDLVLADGRRIHAILDVRSTPDAKAKVLAFINQCTNPRIVVQQHRNNVWVVSMYITTSNASGEDVEISLSKWLREKRLVYD